MANCRLTGWDTHSSEQAFTAGHGEIIGSSLSRRQLLGVPVVIVDVPRIALLAMPRLANPRRQHKKGGELKQGHVVLVFVSC